MARRDGGEAWGRPVAIFLFCFKYEMFVSTGAQAVCAAWVNIWGVRRVCGTLLMFASYALAPFSVLCEFGFSKKFYYLFFDLLVDVFVCCVTRENGVRVLHSPSL